MSGRQRFAEHLAYVAQNGLPAVVELARQSDKSFGADPRGGPWERQVRSWRWTRRNLSLASSGHAAGLAASSECGGGAAIDHENLAGYVASIVGT
jgi:hypothetical protein